MAWKLATRPYCINRSILRASLADKYSSTLKPLTEPPKLGGEGGKSILLNKTDTLPPARMPCQLLATSFPSGDNMPIPVTTTRLRDTASSLLLFDLSDRTALKEKPHNNKEL